MRTILLISPYWKEEHRWMVSSVKLAELWQRIGFKVVVVCMGETKEKRVETEVVSDTLTIHRVHDFFLRDPWNYGIAFGFSSVALRVARELKPDQIVVNKILFWSSFSLIRLRLAGYRVTLLSDALVGITWWPRGRLAQVCAAIYAWTGGQLIMWMANRIVFFHPQPPEVLKKLGVEGKTEVIPTGIDVSKYDGIKNQESRIKSQAVKVCYVGRLESVKGVEDFVMAALKVKRDHPELRIQVVGWYKDGHPLVAAHKDKVEFLGLRSDIPAILSEADIFVLPSYSEGLSNALMEAMSSSCACIASDVGGNTFLIQNGVSGLLFPVGDIDALASHIRRLIEDPHKRRALGKAARERVEGVFDWGVVSQKYQGFFEAVDRPDNCYIV